jgi:hypothetical protein
MGLPLPTHGIFADNDITDICTSIPEYLTNTGYIATPNFPNEYPPNLHCMCSLASLSDDVQIRLEFTHFIIKYDHPCKDWVEIAMDGQVRRLCGAYRSTLLSRALNLTFHSDGDNGHQGLWLNFASKGHKESHKVSEQFSVLLQHIPRKPPLKSASYVVRRSTQQRQPRQLQSHQRLPHQQVS